MRFGSGSFKQQASRQSWRKNRLRWSKIGGNVPEVLDFKDEVMKLEQNPITRERYDAVLFDLDGVLTATAKVHAKCWKMMVDDFPKRHAAENDEPFRPFDVGTDYNPYIRRFSA